MLVPCIQAWRWWIGGRSRRIRRCAGWSARGAGSGLGAWPLLQGPGDYSIPTLVTLRFCQPIRDLAISSSREPRGSSSPSYPCRPRSRLSIASAVQPGDALHDGQAEVPTWWERIRPWLRAIKLVEDSRQVLGLDAASGVGDHDLGEAIPAAQPDGQVNAARCVAYTRRYLRSGWPTARWMKKVDAAAAIAWIDADIVALRRPFPRPSGGRSAPGGPAPGRGPDPRPGSEPWDLGLGEEQQRVDEHAQAMAPRGRRS